MKKIFVVILSLLLVLVACGSKQEVKTDSKEEFKIGIVQLIEHPALDDTRQGFVDRIKELGIDAKIDYQNAQGDLATARTISEKFVADKVDLIYAIATPAAQAAKAATSEIPILFGAITDPVEADLVESNEKPGGNVTGTSDAVNMDEQFEIFKELDPNIKKIGILYTSDEANSLSQLKEAEEKAGQHGLEIVSKSITQLSDLPQLAQAIINQADAFYILTDNKIASSITVLSDLLKENKKISVSAEESQVKGGILISKSLSYLDLGAQTADMAKRILLDGTAVKDIPVERAKKSRSIVNKKTLEILGLDKDNQVFKDSQEVE
ncbi:MAG: ABC transporter substrate-binding protein [Tissierellia bacterium]|nr:ABC transporter substrate-binding protein [Tissierellia bacterium]